MTHDDVKRRLNEGKRIADIRMRRDLEKLDEPVKSERWRNLHFRKNGKSCFGRSEFTSEKAALAAAMDHLSALASDKYNYSISGSGEKYPKSEYSHAIQIPVKG